MRALSQYYLYNPDYCLLYIIFDFPFALLHKKDMPLFFCARNFGGICSLAGFAILLLYCLTVCVSVCIYVYEFANPLLYGWFGGCLPSCPKPINIIFNIRFW